ncbi:class I histocompatibility antigen, F10 alpha chain-like [Mauremys reevesii]|uniref:class I histocompatibility antigen, F10 alpha chain-like n=1 Tax=Mauremys reevesii TaxID=260615 RepID=UPI00193ED68B|nr:class I histocompatibility antigen, F10 alpha chain-like [Mauremys reevesii]
MVARLDDVQIANYSSDTREVRATHEWAEQALGAEYLQEKTQEFWTYEEDSKGGIRRWMQLHNQTDVPPEVSVSCRDTPDSSIILSCRARGFHPRPIHVSWVRDGEDILAEMDSSGILPNADGTYYTQSSLEISLQQDGHRYACRVEHSSLGEPTLVWAPGKKGPLPPGVLAAIVLAVLVLAGAVGAGVVLWRGKSAGPYALAAT